MAAGTSDAAPASTAASGGIAGVGLLFGCIYFVQGVGDPASGLIAQPVRSLLGAWGESPAAMAGFMALLALPWSLKPLLALLSDFVPLLGSRRRSYLLLSSGAAAIGLALLFAVPVPPGERWLLFALLIVPTFAIAFGDVLADALMIEVGKPRGLTGPLQSVQWFAAYGALVAAGVLGGFFASANRQHLAFLLCAALWLGTLLLTLVAVREPRAETVRASARETGRALRGALAVPGLATIGALAFVWDFNPLWVSVLYLHVTDTLGLSEQVYGNGYSIFALGAMAASAAYGLYCRRIRNSVLLNGCIVAGICANALYWPVVSAASFYAASLLAGVAYMTGSLILLDLAARLVPIRVAATVFATVMALANLGSSLAEAAGGYTFEAASDALGAPAAYRLVVGSSVAIVAACWLLLPRLRRQLPEWWR